MGTEDRAESACLRIYSSCSSPPTRWLQLHHRQGTCDRPRAKGDRRDLHVYPLLLEPTPDAGLDRVRDFNLRPRDAKPFSSFPLKPQAAHDRRRERDRRNCQPEIGCRAQRSRSATPEANVKAASTVEPASHPCLPAHHRPARDRLRAAGRARRGAEAPRRSLERRQDQHPLARRRGRRGQIGSGQRMADATASRQLSRRRWSCSAGRSTARARRSARPAADEFLELGAGQARRESSRRPARPPRARRSPRR